MKNVYCVLTDEQLAWAKPVAAEMATVFDCIEKKGGKCHDCDIYLSHAECPLASLEKLIEFEDCRREIVE